MKYPAPRPVPFIIPYCATCKKEWAQDPKNRAGIYFNCPEDTAAIKTHVACLVSGKYGKMWLRLEDLLLKYERSISNFFYMYLLTPPHLGTFLLRSVLLGIALPISLMSFPKNITAVALSTIAILDALLIATSISLPCHPKTPPLKALLFISASYIYIAIAYGIIYFSIPYIYIRDRTLTRFIQISFFTLTRTSIPTQLNNSPVGSWIAITELIVGLYFLIIALRLIPTPWAMQRISPHMDEYEKLFPERSIQPPNAPPHISKSGLLRNVAQQISAFMYSSKTSPPETNDSIDKVRRDYHEIREKITSLKESDLSTLKEKMNDLNLKIGIAIAVSGVFITIATAVGIKTYSDINGYIEKDFNERLDKSFSYYERFGRALALYNANDYLNATPIFREMHRNKPDDETVFSNLIDCLIQIENYDEAISLILTSRNSGFLQDKFQEQLTYNNSGYATLITAINKPEHFELSLELLKHAERLGSKNGEAFTKHVTYNLTIYYTVAGDIENAKTYLNRIRIFYNEEWNLTTDELWVKRLIKNGPSALKNIRAIFGKEYPKNPSKNK